MKRIILISALLLAVIFTVSADRRRLLGARNVVAGDSRSTPDVLAWDLNEGSGTTHTTWATVANSGGTNRIAWVTGANGGGSAFRFNGTECAVSSNNVAYASNVITLSFSALWARTNSAQMLFETGTSGFLIANGFYVSLAGAGMMEILISGNTGGGTDYKLSNYPLGATNVWAHWLVLLDGSTGAGNIRVWRNSIEQSSLGGSGARAGTANFTTSQLLYVGARTLNSLQFAGSLDSVEIHNGDKSADVATIGADQR